MSFERFMELALYHPELGYYRSTQTRVGYGSESDFFTSSTSGSIFGELLIAACSNLLLSQGAAPADFSFVEIGSETDQGVLAGLAHPFASAKTLRVGAPLRLTGPCVVFSNELFDAQPCRRFLRKGGRWIECGVGDRDGDLVEVDLNPVEASWLPDGAVEGFRFDAPRSALALAQTLACEPWSGLFVAIDYGKSFAELAEFCPQGTLRAYHRHSQSNDLLARPGEQDLTCHVCWDWLEEAFVQGGFTVHPIESQEAFFVKHAGNFIEQTIAAEALRASQRKLALLQLLHPAHLGQKFQVLHAWRA